MRDKDSRPPLNQLIIPFIHLALRNGVKGSGGLVQNDHGSVLVEGPGQHELLYLTPGQGHARLVQILVHESLRPLRQRLHPLPEPRLFQTLPKPFRILPPTVHTRHIVRQWEGEGEHVLEHHSEFPEDCPLVQRLDVPSVQIYSAGGRTVEAAQELDESGLARAVWPHQRQALSRPDGQVQIPDGIFFAAFISEAHMLEPNLMGAPGSLRRLSSFLHHTEIHEVPVVVHKLLILQNLPPGLKQPVHPCAKSCHDSHIEQK